MLDTMNALVYQFYIVGLEVLLYQWMSLLGFTCIITWYINIAKIFREPGIKSPADQLFTQHLIQAKNKYNMKTLHESTFMMVIQCVQTRKIISNNHADETMTSVN